MLRVVPGSGPSPPAPFEQRPRVPDRLAGAPFVGRGRELGSLLVALEQAAAGRGQLRMVVGEPGIGKTRLANELSDRATQAGALVLWGRCWEEGGSPSYWPWIQIVRSYLRRVDAPTLTASLGSSASSIAQIVPEVREKLAPLAVPGLLDVEQARFRLFDAMGTFLGRIADAQPLVLVLDDLHTADRTSLLLLRFLGRQLHALPIFVVGTYREADARRIGTTEQVLAELTREGELVRLVGLRSSDVERFIRETTGTAPDASLVRDIVELTQGNPFFIDEMVRLFAAGGSPHGRGRRPLAGLRVPDEVRDVIRRRLEPLGADARELLAAASVIGRVFDVALLQQGDEVAGERVVNVLAGAVAADVLVEVAGMPGRYAFAHALVRETLYQDLAPGTRASIHHRIAGILETRHARDPGPHLDALAHHFYEAALSGGADKATVYQAAAGRRALDVLAYEEAAEHFERALRALELSGGPEPERCELLLLLAEARGKAGEPGAARAALSTAAALARTLRSPEMLARAALGTGPGFVGLGLAGGIVDVAMVRLLEDALAAMGGRDGPLHARLLGRLAMELRGASAEPRRTSLIREAVNVARGAGDPAALAFALSASHLALWGPENAGERLATAREVVQLADGAGDVELGLRGRIWLLTDLLELGDLPAADRAFEQYRSGAEQLGQPLYLWFSSTWRAMRAGLEGRFDDAERLAADALAAGRQMDEPDAEPAFVAQMIALHAGRGLSGFEAATAALVDRHEDAPAWRSALALIFCDQGSERDARREFDRLAAGDFADIPRNADWLITTFNLAQACCFLLDHARAAVLYDLLLPFADRCVVARSALVCLGSVSRALGMLAGTMSRWPEAEAHFESALQVNERLGARPLVALTQFAYAMMLLARSQANDEERARALLGEVRDAATALRMDVLARWIEPLGSFAEHRGPPSEGPASDGPDATGRATFREDGDCWAVGFGDELVRVRPAAGFRYLALLLRSPGIAFQAMELVEAAGRAHPGAAAPADPVAQDAGRAGRVSVGLGDAGESLDSRAQAEYRRRLAELRAELDEAQGFADSGRAARCQAEIEFLRAELARGLGLGGRPRRAGSHVERARVNVTRAIHRAVDTLRDRTPRLARYLDTTIRTGTWCSYTPDPRFRISWTL